MGKGSGERGRELPCLSPTLLSPSTEVGTQSLTPMLGSAGKGGSSSHLTVASFQEHSGCSDCSHFYSHCLSLVAGVTVIRIMGRLSGKLTVS